MKLSFPVNNSVDFERAVHSQVLFMSTSAPTTSSSCAIQILIVMFQPYRTSPLVTPAPRTISEMRAGGSSYQVEFLPGGRYPS